MKILKHSLLLLASIPTLYVVQAQTVDEIINKHFDALGGKAKIDQIKSVTSESVVQVMGNEAPSKIILLSGKGYRLESEFNGQKMIQVFTDKSGWAVNPMSGNSDPQPMPDEVYKAGKDQLDPGGALNDYAAKGNKVELLGKEDSSYKLKVTNKDNVVSTIYIDASTYFVKKVVQTGNMMGQDVEITRTLSDYRKTDFGVLFPYAIEISYGPQFSISSSVKKIEINKDIDPKIFDMSSK